MQYRLSTKEDLIHHGTFTGHVAVSPYHDSEHCGKSQGSIYPFSKNMQCNTTFPPKKHDALGEIQMVFRVTERLSPARA